MRRLRKVIVQGFGLYKERHEIDLTQIPDDSIIGIFGSNLDGEGGYDSNASGKTTFTNCISWGLFGTLPIQGESTRALTKEQIVNHECKKALVGLEYQIDNDLIYFESTMSEKGHRNISLEINGSKFEANTTTQVRNKFYSLLGISGGDKSNFIDFLNRCYFSGDVTKSFASKNFSDRDRLNIVSKIRKLDVYDVAIANAEKLAKVYKQRINELEFKLQDKLNTFVSLTSLKQLEELKDSFSNKLKSLEEEREIIQAELEKMNKIIKFKTDIEDLKDKLIPVRKKIDDQINLIKKYCDRLNSLKKEYNEVNISLEEYSAYSNMKTKKLELETNINFYKAKIDEVNKAKILNSNELLIIKKEIKDLQGGNYLTCPVCNTSLLLDSDHLHKIDIEKINSSVIEKNIRISHLENSIEIYLSSLTKDNSLIKSLETEKEELISKSSMYTNLNDRLIDIENKYNEVSKDVEDFVYEEDIIKPKEEYLDYTKYIDYQNLDSEIKSKELELKSIGDLKYDINDLNMINERMSIQRNLVKKKEEEIETYKKYETEISEVNLELEEENTNFKKYDYWKNGFKQLKNIELIETEPELENTVNRILNEIGTGIVIQFDVRVEEGELAINLIEDSGNDLPLELFSTGQANRISFASGLALSELASDSNIEYGFTMWDEVLDGLDNTGQDMFFEVLRKLPGLKFVISHDKKLQGFFEYKIIATRKNHSSNIKLMI